MAASAGSAEGGSSVGRLLRDCRQKAGFDLDELSRHLRIRRRFLEAIEEGRLHALPGATYAIGFVRTYAEYFGLDGNEIVRRFRAETGEKETSPALNFPAPVTEGGTPKAALVFIGLLVAAVVYGVWYVDTLRNDAPVELVYPVPDRLRPAAPESAPPARTEPSATPSVPATDPSSAPRATASTATAEAPTAEAGGTPSADVAAQPGTMTPVVPETPSRPATATASVAEATAPPADAVGAPSRIVLRANAETWVQIRDTARKSVLVSRTLAPGEAFAVPDRPGLSLTTGNAGGLDVLVDGDRLPPLGRAGAVRRNVTLDAEGLRQAAAPGT